MVGGLRPLDGVRDSPTLTPCLKVVDSLRPSDGVGGWFALTCHGWALDGVGGSPALSALLALDLVAHPVPRLAHPRRHRRTHLQGAHKKRTTMCEIRTYSRTERRPSTCVESLQHTYSGECPQTQDAPDGSRCHGLRHCLPSSFSALLFSHPTSFYSFHHTCLPCRRPAWPALPRGWPWSFDNTPNPSSFSIYLTSF
jgi:hypothetical protein